MNYEGLIIRPPSEAYSLLLQVTVGCSHNRCTFCPTYKDKPFRIKSFAEIVTDIDEASRYSRAQRVFLCDGDALIIPQERLIEILLEIKTKMPQVERIATYANAKSILKKTPEQLQDLHRHGLSMIYLGIESGNNEVLQAIQKGGDFDKIVSAGKRAKVAGFTLSVAVLLGIGGNERSIPHALDTAKILSAIDPDFVGALTLMVVPETPLHEELLQGRFSLPNTFGLLHELELMIAHSHFTSCFFTANHASNYLPIRARLPHEKEKVLKLIRSVIAQRDKTVLRHETMRAL
ncbi:MAG: radical SAM protein [Deltaproteobacteria bacterium]|nr:radical SAM protein [Deltaproteobacteria bacterium]